MATKKKTEETEPEVQKSEEVVVSDLEHFRYLYSELKKYAVNSIGDLEVKIARLQ